MGRFDKVLHNGYNLAILAKIDVMEVRVATKLISSTEAQNNFGRLIDDVVQYGTKYVIQRRGVSQAVVLSIREFDELLSANNARRSKTAGMFRQFSPRSSLGTDVFMAPEVHLPEDEE